MKMRNVYKRIALFIAFILLAGTVGCEGITSSGKENSISDVIDYSYPKELPSEDQLSTLTNVKTLILTGQNVDLDTIDHIQSNLQDCEIIYDIQIDGQMFSSSAEVIETDSMDIEDCNKLERFKKLKYLNVENTECTAELDEYGKSHPDTIIVYKKDILGVPMRNIDTYLDLTESMENVETIEKALSENPQIQEVCLVNSFLSNDEKALLHETFPDIVFYYTVDVKGSEMRSTDSRIDFTLVNFDDGIKEVASLLKCFMKPEWVDVSRQFFENSDMEWIQQQFPDTMFAWVVPIGALLNMRTDQQVFNGTESYRTLKTSDIENLKYCKNLKALDLNGQDIHDISCLEGLENLEYLRIGGNSITDISALKNMKKLKYLELYGNGIYDISVLENLENLEDLNLNQNNIDDITPLLKLKNLKCLYISQNPVSNDDEAMNTLYLQFPGAEIITDRESARGGFANTESSAHADSMFKGKIYMEAE